MAEESPLDRFKSALTGASRAIAHEPELELSWTADNAVQSGKNLRVPMPGRGLPDIVAGSGTSSRSATTVPSATASASAPKP